MPSFSYRAVQDSGRVAKGVMTAANENELAQYLRSSGMELIDAREQKEKSFQLPVLVGRDVPPRVLAGFCVRMHDLLLSGLSFVDALGAAREACDNRILREALTHIGQSIDNGGGIACSFALYPRIFSSILLAIIGAGEKSGDMVAIFAFLARYADKNALIQERLRRALRYPLFLLVVAGGAVAFMLSMVVPQVVLFLNGIQSHLPLATRMLIALSELFTVYGVWVLSVCAILFLAGFFLRRFMPWAAVAQDGVLLRLPVIGNLISKMALARFAHSFTVLFRSGCDMPDCLAQARGTVGNRALNQGIVDAERRVQAGAALSEALDGVMPPFALGLLRTGERSGNLGKSLEDIAVAYDREAQAATDNFIGLLEPSLTLAIGALLAWTVIAVLGPLYGSLSILGARM